MFFYMFRGLNQTFHRNNKKNSLDKNGEGIMVLDYAISAQKYPKIVPQEKKKIRSQSYQFSEIKGFAKIYLTKGIRLNIFVIPSPWGILVGRVICLFFPVNCESPGYTTIA